MQNFVIEPLAASSVLEAWPLVHLAIPGLDLRTWRRVARVKRGPARGRARGGILVARRSGRRPICGMVWYRCEYDLGYGRVLRVKHLLAIDILDPAPILTALLRRLGPVAQALNCATIHVTALDQVTARLLPKNPVLSLKLHMGLEQWLDISFSAELLSRDETNAPLDTDQCRQPAVVA